MPRKTTIHQPTFTPEQLSLARKVARQSSAPLRAVQRARLTLLLAESPHLTHGQIAALAGLDPDTVYKWRRRWAAGEWSLEDAPRSGRPRAVSP